MKGNSYNTIMIIKNSYAYKATNSIKHTTVKILHYRLYGL